MAEEATRQRYKLATGGGTATPPPSKPNPGFKKGGSVGKSAGGQAYRSGGSTKKR